MDRLVTLLLLGLLPGSALALPPPTPRKSDALVEQASRALEAGETEAAMRLLSQAQDADGRDPRPRFLRGSALARTDPRGAEREYRAALALEPTLAPVHAELGALLLDGGNVAEACSELGAATRFDPALAVGWQNLARCEARLDHHAAALSAYARAEQLLPGDADVRIDHAMALRKAQRLEEAEKVARAAVAIDGRSAPAQQALGFVLSSRGRLDDAVAAFTAASRLDPKSGAALWALGNAERDRHHDEAAVAALTRAVALDPRPPVAIDLAEVQSARGRHDEALATLAAAIARSPRSLGLQIARAKVQAAAGRCAEAHKTLAGLPRTAPVLAAEPVVTERCSRKRK